MTIAVTKLTHIMRAAGAVDPAPEPPPNSAEEKLSSRLPPGSIGIGAWTISCAVCDAATNARYSGNATISTPSTITRWLSTRKRGRVQPWACDPHQ